MAGEERAGGAGGGGLRPLGASRKGGPRAGSFVRTTLEPLSANAPHKGADVLVAGAAWARAGGTPLGAGRGGAAPWGLGGGAGDAAGAGTCGERLEPFGAQPGGSGVRGVEAGGGRARPASRAGLGLCAEEEAFLFGCWDGEDVGAGALDARDARGGADVLTLDDSDADSDGGGGGGGARQLARVGVAGVAAVDGSPSGAAAPRGVGPEVRSPPPPSYYVDTPSPSPRTNRTRRVPHPVLSGHAASLTPY